MNIMSEKEFERQVNKAAKKFAKAIPAKVSAEDTIILLSAIACVHVDLMSNLGRFRNSNDEKDIDFLNMHLGYLDDALRSAYFEECDNED